MFDTQQQDEFCIVTMRHGKVNAQDLEFCRELTSVLNELDGNECRGAVLTGQERVFSAGVDLKRLIEEDESYLEEFLPAIINLFETLFGFSKPLVSAINGHAVAGGCIIASACDYRLLAPKAKIGIPELRVGVPLPCVAIEIMRSVAAPSVFQKMVNIGSTYSGELAVRMGLADELVEKENQVDIAMQHLRQLTQIPSRVFTLSKKQLRNPAMNRIREARKAFQDQIFELWRSDEVRSAIRVYVDQRL